MIELRIYSYITPWSTVPIGHTAAELSYTIGDDTLYNWDPEDIAVNGSDFFEIRGRQANIEMFNHYQAAEFASNMLRATQYFIEYRDWETDRKSTRLNSSHSAKSRMPSSA